MSKIYGSRKAVVLILLVLVLTPWHLAAQEPVKSSAGISDWLQQMWSYLMAAWQGTEAGAELDPNGRVGSEPTDSSDAGAELDPFGRT